MIAPVPFVALDRQHAPLREELNAAFARVVGSSAFILGSEVGAFEDEFASYCGVEHCVGVASGTAALTLTLKAAGIGPGDEVIVPAHTFIASALGVFHAGAAPVYCDVDDETGLIDPSAMEAALNERTAAILAVHLYGQCCDMSALAEIARAHGLALIEDAAQAHGATHRGSRTGSLGTAGCFSFYPSKNLGALGDGGAICTNDASLAERARALRHLGQHKKGSHEVLGYNERLDGLQAALLRVKLPHVDGWNKARRDSARRYAELLPNGVLRLVERPETPCIFHVFPIRVRNRDAFAAELADRGVETGVHYFPACVDQPPLRGSSRGEFPAARAWAQEELSLPMFEHLTETELERVAVACAAAVHT